jgi:MFS family permease
MAIFGVAHMLGALLLATLADRFGRKPVILWTAYPGALTVVIIYYLLGSMPALAIGFLFLGFFQGSVPSLVVALAQESAAPETVGTASGFVMSLHYVSAVITPLVAAQLIASTGHMLLSMGLASAVPFAVYGSLIAAVRARSGGPAERVPPSRVG